jgi:hypothetical protein
MATGKENHSCLQFRIFEKNDKESGILNSCITGVLL